MSYTEAVTLFRRLGVNVEIMTEPDFRIRYFALAKQYHPDRNPPCAELMANINAARTVILNSYRKVIA
jgi:curved DNA-binding protein CbpA